LSKGLSVDGFYSVDKSFNFTKTFSVPYTLYNYDSAKDAYNGVVTGGSAGKASLTQKQINITNITQNIRLSYLHQFGKHNVNAFVAYEQNKRNESTFEANRINYPTASTPELSQGGAAATDKNNSGSSYNFTRKSFIGRIAYNFNEKYLAEVQARVDGSSVFPKGNQFGFFPSISAGYRISEEDWFKNSVSFIDDLKIRASYGSLGNDNVGQFQYYNNYSFNNQYVTGSNVITPGIDLTKLANPNITWETSKKMDIGLNAVVLKRFQC
jgi:hypothetical protein